MSVNVKLFEDLDAVAEDAGGALDRRARGLLFERLDWFRLVARHTPPERLVVIRARDHEAAGWLFLDVRGRTAHALGNWYSLRWGPILSCSSRESCYRIEDALARALRRIRPRLAALDFYPVSEGSTFPDLLRRSGWLVRSEQASTAFAMSTMNMGFEAYWQKRPGKLRSTAKRKGKAAALEIDILDRFDADAWAAYESVYAASWKPEEGSPAFLRALAEQEGAAGNLRLGIARREGVPIAAQLWLTERGVATIHKLAYREDARAFSPGTILSEAMFRQALDVDRVHSIDFGLGEDAYKADWIDHSRPVFRVTAYDPLSLQGLPALAGKLVRKVRRG